MRCGINMETKFWEDIQNCDLVLKWVECETEEEKAYLLDNDDSWIAQLCREYPTIRNSIISILDNQIGTGHKVYVVKFDHPDLRNHFKLGRTQDPKKRNGDKQNQINGIVPKVSEVCAQFTLQAGASEKMEKEIKRLVKPNGNLKETGVITDPNHQRVVGYTEYYLLDKLDEVIKTANELYPKYKNMIGVKRVN